MIWKTIPDYPNYEVSENGDVRRSAPGKNTYVGRVLIQNKKHKYGYPQIGLTLKGKRINRELHKLVALAFHGKPKFKKAEVAHEDGNPLNNNYKNLKWKTHKQNEKDKIRHGTSAHGENNGQSLLNNNKVKAIRKMREKGYTLRDIGNKFNVAFQTVSKVTNHKSWRHI